MSELKPCPFCGNKNIVMETIAETLLEYNPDEWNKTHYNAVCSVNENGCGASTGWQHATKENAAIAWNQRSYENG